ncbi:MAG: CDP-alcohol phosphatidyltransferase family protein [Promethearchaeota archaeon]
MVSNKLRHVSNKIIFPIAKRFEGSRISPNIITLLGLLVIFISSTLIAIAGALQLDSLFLIIALILIGLGGFLDLLDGGVAKITGQKTRFGGILDSVVDRYSDGFLIISLIMGNYLAVPFIVDLSLSRNLGIILGFVGLLGAFLTSYARSRAEIEGVKMAGVGLIERAERIVAIAVSIFLEIIFPGMHITFYVFVVLAILMNFTAAQRVKHAYNELKKEEGK